MLGNMQNGSLKITIGDLCEAIQGGMLPVRQRGDWYSIKRHHLVKYLARLIAEKAGQ